MHFASASGTRSQSRDAQLSAQAAPVHVAIVESKTFPVVLNGLGTVQATNTVTVRSRVDGQIEKVAFEEGQMVQGGRPARADRPGAVPGSPQSSRSPSWRRTRPASPTPSRIWSARRCCPSRATPPSNCSTSARPTSPAWRPRFRPTRRPSTAPRCSSPTPPSRSPLTGRAGFRLVDPGNIVHASDQTGILDDHAAAADLGDLHGARAAAARHQRGAEVRAAEGHCLQLGRQEGAGRGHAQADRQSGRSGERHHPAEGELRQPRQGPVAGPLGDHAPAGRRPSTMSSSFPTAPCSADPTASMSMSSRPHSKAELRDVKVGRIEDGDRRWSSKACRRASASSPRATIACCRAGPCRCSTTRSGARP